MGSRQTGFRILNENRWFLPTEQYLSHRQKQSSSLVLSFLYISSCFNHLFAVHLLSWLCISQKISIFTFPFSPQIQRDGKCYDYLPLNTTRKNPTVQINCHSKQDLIENCYFLDRFSNGPRNGLILVNLQVSLKFLSLE